MSKLKYTEQKGIIDSVYYEELGRDVEVYVENRCIRKYENGVSIKYTVYPDYMKINMILAENKGNGDGSIALLCFILDNIRPVVYIQAFEWLEDWYKLFGFRRLKSDEAYCGNYNYPDSELIYMIMEK